MNCLTLSLQLLHRSQLTATLPYWIEVIDENRWEIIGASAALWALAEGFHYFRTKRRQ